MSKVKVVVQRRGAQNDREIEELKTQFPQAEILLADTAESVTSLIRDAEVLIGTLTPESFGAAKKLRWFQTYSTGMDWMLNPLDSRYVPGMADSDVVVTNTRGAFAQTIAEHTFALILTFTRAIKTSLEDQATHRWGGGPKRRPMEGLAGRNIGIVGLGQIGSAIARRASGFEMDVYAVDVQPFPHVADLCARWGLNRLDELCQLSDFLVIAAPLTPETRGMIDARRIGLMKPGAYLIVVSRGYIVDEQALAEALATGRLAGAGLDATSVEPLPADSPLWDLDNVVITPHNSGSSTTTGRMIWDISVENLRRYLEGKPLLNVVDKRAGY